jgi:hypothetical protein
MFLSSCVEHITVRMSQLEGIMAALRQPSLSFIRRPPLPGKGFALSGFETDFGWRLPDRDKDRDRGTCAFRRGLS